MLRPQDASDVLKSNAKAHPNAVPSGGRRQAEAYRGTREDLDEFLKVIHATEEEKWFRSARAYYERILDSYGDDAYLMLCTLNISKAIDVFKTHRFRI